MSTSHALQPPAAQAWSPSAGCRRLAQRQRRGGGQHAADGAVIMMQQLRPAACAVWGPVRGGGGGGTCAAARTAAPATCVHQQQQHPLAARRAPRRLPHTPQHRARQARSWVGGAAGPPSAVALAAAPAAAAATSEAGQVLAVLLGWCMLIGSCFRSVPQIVKVVRSGTAEGLSLTSNVVELLCYTVIFAYNAAHGYALNTYGEVVACWLQDVVLVAMILKHLRVPVAVCVGGWAAFAGVSGVLLWPGLVPLSVLAGLQLSTLVVMALGSRVPQLYLNWRRGNAGVLSMTTCTLNVLGNCVRIFTTMVLTHDALLLAGNVTQGALNGGLLWQVWQTRFGGHRHAAPAAAQAGPKQPPHQVQQQERSGSSSLRAGGGDPNPFSALGVERVAPSAAPAAG